MELAEVQAASFRVKDDDVSAAIPNPR